MRSCSTVVLSAAESIDLEYSVFIMLDINHLFALTDKEGSVVIVSQSGGMYRLSAIHGAESVERDGFIELQDDIDRPNGRESLNDVNISTLTKDQLVDKINRDIALWKTSQEEKKDDFIDDFFDNRDNIEKSEQISEPVYLEPIKF